MQYCLLVIINTFFTPPSQEVIYDAILQITSREQRCTAPCHWQGTVPALCGKQKVKDKLNFNLAGFILSPC
ncbi:hypothetical protein, partial [Akkermansia sp.]|uniref:hypothetical protein n=1 Tax=Akkermansia sp. TaxID=1872421 RepID=UPI003FD81F59